jgi:short-subunit dehydrogenase
MMADVRRRHAMTYQFAAITGATSGIGAAFARVLPAETGLLLSGRNEARLAELRTSLARPGRRIETVAADLATEAGRARLIAAARALPIDLLVNNAGLGRVGGVIDNPEAAEREMVEVNVVAVAVLGRALLPDMIARAEAAGRRAGLIVVASTAAFQPCPYIATYGATKAFDLIYAEALAVELKDRAIDVLALCPGGTDTAFFERAGTSAREFGRLAPPERVAREGLAALGRRRVHVVGALNRLGAMLVRFPPRRAVADISGRALRRLISRRGRA